MRAIRSSDSVFLVDANNREVWRGDLVDYFVFHAIREPRKVLSVVDDLGEHGEHAHMGGLMFKLKLAGRSFQMRRVNRDEFFAFMNPLDVYPRVRIETLKDPYIVSDWETRMCVGRSASHGSGKNEYFLIERPVTVERE